MVGRVGRLVVTYASPSSSDSSAFARFRAFFAGAFFVATPFAAGAASFFLADVGAGGRGDRDPRPPVWAADGSSSDDESPPPAKASSSSSMSDMVAGG